LTVLSRSTWALFQEPTNRANGLTRDLQGRLIACEHDSRRVTRQELDGSITVIANSFQGRQLNRPNDVVDKSDGCIYFTDPWTSPAAPEQWDLAVSGVYRVTPDFGTISLLISDFIVPNGLAFSPDESVLYVNDSRRGHIRAFDLMPNGTFAKQTDRVFVDLRGSEQGVPDGMKVDVEGNVYCGGAGGLWIMDPHGKKLGCIVHGAPATTNLAFGGDDWKTLYFTSRNPSGRHQRENLRRPGAAPEEIAVLPDPWTRAIWGRPICQIRSRGVCRCIGTYPLRVSRVLAQGRIRWSTSGPLPSDHLRAHGVEITFEEDRQGGVLNGPRAYFYDPEARCWSSSI
jgi:sugar lactone lactonase YvrE